MTKTARGGWRPGSGRKPGLASIRAEESRKYMVDEIAKELDPILAGLIDLAKGSYSVVKDAKGIKRIYRQLPDAKVAMFLVNQVAGRPKETAEVTMKHEHSLLDLAKRRKALPLHIQQDPFGLSNPKPPSEIASFIGGKIAITKISQQKQDTSDSHKENNKITHQIDLKVQPHYSKEEVEVVTFIK